MSASSIEYGMKQTAAFLIETLEHPQNEIRDATVKSFIELLMRYYLMLELTQP